MSQMENQNQEEYRSRGLSPALIGFIVLVILGAVFIIQNRERTEIHLLFFEFNNRVWTVIAISLALGVVLDRLFTRWWRRRREG